MSDFAKTTLAVTMERDIDEEEIAGGSQNNRGTEAGMGEEAMSFQDAEELIDKDEKERLQFMNSNLTFDGIDQMEVPSLLSLTSYFQQGSSFPVPYAGNESTMMFGGGFPPGVSSFMDPQLASETLRRFSSSSSSQQYSLRNSSITRRASTSKMSAAPNNSTVGSASVASEKSDITRQDSLAKFFLGPEAKGLDKTGIMEHVLDYCKRRASFRDSDTFTLNSPYRGDESDIDGADLDPAGSNEKTVIDLRNKMDTKIVKNHLGVTKLTKVRDVKTKDNNDSPTVPNDHQDDSIVISSDRAAIRKLKEEPLLNASDLGSNEGFENFKRNLTHGRDRYRDKVNHRVVFEKKRLQIDERCSHPQLSPNALSGPGATASLERPSKRMLCNSPPEKLVTSKKEPVTRDQKAVINREELQTPRMNDGQFHSTPVAVDSFIKRISNVNVQKSSRLEPVSSSRRAAEPGRSEGKKEDRNKGHGIDRKETHSSGRDSISSELSSKKQSSGTQIRRRKSPLSATAKEKEMDTQATQIVELSTSDSCSNDASNSNILKPCNSNTVALPLPPQNPSIVPIIHTTGQPHQQHQHFGGGQQCSCPHQCGQQSISHGIPGMMQGLPIVIHIHLPAQTTTTGAVVHPVPTPTSEAPPK